MFGVMELRLALIRFSTAWDKEGVRINLKIRPQTLIVTTDKVFISKDGREIRQLLSSLSS